MSLKRTLAAAALATAAGAATAGPVYLLTITGNVGNSTNVLTGNPGTATPSYLAAGAAINMQAVIDTDLDTDLASSPNYGFFNAITSTTLQTSTINIGSTTGTIEQTIAGAINTQNFQSGGALSGLPAGLNSLIFSFTGQDNGDPGAILSNADLLGDDFLSFGNSNTIVAELFLQSGVNFERVAINNMRYEFTEVSAPVPSVPEPSTLALLGAGALGALAFSRRRTTPAADRAPV